MDEEATLSAAEVTVSVKQRLKLFCKLYWRSLVIIFTPIILMPVAFVGDFQDTAYRCLYLFLIMAVYLVSEAVPACITGLMPVVFSPILGIMDSDHTCQVYMRNGIVNTLGCTMMIIAMEYSEIHKRIGLKIMNLLGCSHYRLSFMLFFITMFLSMWIANTVAASLMMPIVKAILMELDKLGIMDMYHQEERGKKFNVKHEQRLPDPTDMTIFYFLGIAYSASVGGTGTLVGSRTNAMFKHYAESYFPEGPIIDFPLFMLHNLPGMLVTQFLIYVWMTFFFLGMFRSNSDIALQIHLTEEEVRLFETLVATQYNKLGRIKFQEIVVGVTMISTVILHAMLNPGYVEGWGQSNGHFHIKTSTPTALCILILFLTPADVKFCNFFKKKLVAKDVPTSTSRSCLNWNLIATGIPWDIIFTIGGSCAIFEGLKDTGMAMQMERILLAVEDWPRAFMVLAVIVLCKALTEFAPNATTAYVFLPVVAHVSVVVKMNPHYLMLAATLACSYPFHLVTGTPPNVMVASYVHIPPWKMMYAGIGPSVIVVLVTWFSVTVWAKAVWAGGITEFPAWAQLAS